MQRALATLICVQVGCASTPPTGPSEPPLPVAIKDAAADADPPMSAEAVRAVLEAELRLQEGDVAGAVRLLKEAVLFDPASPYLHVRLAEAYLDSGDAEQALIAARAALALDPRSVPALRVVGAAQALTGDAAAAQRSYARALEIAPADRQTSTALTELLVEQGDTQGAERVVERLMEAEPGAVDGYVALGRVFAQRGDVQRAFSHLQRALAREPLDQDALELQLALLEALGRFADAKKTADTLARAVGDTPLVRRELLAVTALADRQADADAMARAWLADDESEAMRLLVADAWRRAGDLERALAVLAPATGARAQIDRAIMLLTLRRLEAARADACTAVDRAPDAETRDTAVAVCTRALAALGRGKDAVALTLRHLDDRPTSAGLLDALEQLMRKPVEGVLADALLPRLERAATQAPNDADVIAVLSRAHESRGAIDSARAVLDEALRARPSDPDLLLVLARFLDRQGQAGGAAEIAERLIDRGRRDLDTLNFVAFALADAGLRGEDARRYAWRAVVLDPLNGYVVDTLGWATFASGDARGALDVLRRADRLSPNEGEVLFHIATAQQLDGDRTGALTTARRAHALTADEPRVQARIEALLKALGDEAGT